MLVTIEAVPRTIAVDMFVQAVRIPKMLVGLGNMLKTKHLSFEQAMADNEAKADILAYIGQYAEA